MAVLGISQPSALLLSKSRLQRSYLWDVLLPDMNSALGSLTALGGLLEGFQGLAVAQYCQGVQFGDYDIEDIVMKVGPYQQHFAGLLSVQDVTLTFLKPSPDFVTYYFNGWRDLIIDKTGLYKPKRSYQKNVYVRFLDATGIAINRYKLIGCYPRVFPAYNLDYLSNDITKVVVKLVVDKIEIE